MKVISPCRNCESRENRKVCSQNCEKLENFRRLHLSGPSLFGRDDEGISSGRRVLPAPRYVIERY